VHFFVRFDQLLRVRGSKILIRPAEQHDAHGRIELRRGVGLVG
jgi:hypothetical protein